MIKPFLSIISLLFLLILGIVVDYSNYDYSSKKENLNHIIGLTSNASLSLSVGYDKPRILHGLKTTTIYPEVETTSSLEFIYVK